MWGVGVVRHQYGAYLKQAGKRTKNHRWDYHI